MGEASHRRVTYSQLEHLWEFLDKRRDIAMGYNKTSHAREFSRRMWEEIALALNSHGDGAMKDWKGWCKYWNDYKCKIKKLAAVSKASQHKTGGGQSKIKSMTDIEKKFLQILGDDFGSGLPGIRVEPFEEEVLSQIEMTQTTPETHSRPLNSGCSESILTGMEAAYFESLPGPSRRISPHSPIPTRQPSHSTPSHLQQLSMLTPHTPHRSPRYRQHAPGSASPEIHPYSSAPPRRSPRLRQNNVKTSLQVQLPPTAPPHIQLSPIAPPHIQLSPTEPLHIQLSPRAPSEAHLAPTSSHTQRAPITERRRQSRREPPMTVEKARRALIAESQKQTKIQEEKLKLFGILIQEIREMKEFILTRFNNWPARDGE